MTLARARIVYTVKKTNKINKTTLRSAVCVSEFYTARLPIENHAKSECFMRRETIARHFIVVVAGSVAAPNSHVRRDATSVRWWSDDGTNASPTRTLNEISTLAVNNNNNSNNNTNGYT